MSRRHDNGRGRRSQLERDTCREFVVPRLREAGWSTDQIVEEHYFTDGRVVTSIKGHRRQPGLRADYVLELEPDFPVAVVEAKRLRRRADDGLQQAMRYARILELPFAYSTNGDGIVEHDFDTGEERRLSRFPSPDELGSRYQRWKGLSGDAESASIPFTRALRTPDGAVKTPRYYQRIAVDMAVEAVLTGRKRLLLTLATGTGKTFVALQIVWKLWDRRWPSGRRRPRVLYVADRNILVDQPIDREFRPVFKDAVWKVGGGSKTGREIYFALYQAIGDGEAAGIFRDYPKDYFDLVIVDECHRGSARDESNWRSILDHFAPATQIGMTATPLRTENADTYRYFGDPLVEYSLAQGIEDGFLAPYRVRRVVLEPDAEGWRPTLHQLDEHGREIPDELYTTPQFERVVSLLDRTRAIARHVTNYLEATNPFDKTIVYCVDQEHAGQMRDALIALNLERVRQHPDYVARIVADEGDVGREHLGRFTDPESETPVIVTTSRLLTTGVDIPTCRNIVIARPIGSMVEFKQLIGRGTRLYPDADKLSFTILDYTGATALFADPDFDGEPELLVRSEVDEQGQELSEETIREPSSEDLDSPTNLPDVPPDARKYYVDGTEAAITAEAVYLLDPDGKGPRVVSYDAYVADQVRRLYPDAGDLRTKWLDSEGRMEIVEALQARGITFDELASRTGLVDADPFDLLVHIAWNGSVSSRRDRANRLRREHADYLEAYSGAAREVLEELLEKYADHGIDQLDDLRVLEVPPLADYGTPVEIAARFGGARALRDAVAGLESRLYST